MADRAYPGVRKGAEQHEEQRRKHDTDEFKRRLAGGDVLPEREHEGERSMVEERGMLSPRGVAIEVAHREGVEQ